MDTQQDRLLQFDRDLLSGKNICSSRGVLVTFPSSLKKLFHMKGLGVIICHRGSFQFSLNQKVCSAKAGESLFIPEEGAFQVLQESEDMEVQILIYQIEPIRDIMGNAVVTMYMYSRITPDEPSCVWTTGEEEEITKYMSLLDSAVEVEENPFKLYEQKLLLLALTYRICSMYNRKLVNDGEEAGGRKNEVFIRLIQLNIICRSGEWNFMRINSVCLLNIFLRFQKVYAGIQYRNLYLRRLSVKVSRC